MKDFSPEDYSILPPEPERMGSKGFAGCLIHPGDDGRPLTHRGRAKVNRAVRESRIAKYAKRVAKGLPLGDRR